MSIAPFPSDHFVAGTRVGDYVIGELASYDDTGAAYHATHILLPRKITLKVMRGGHEWSRPVAVQLLREACLLEALAHAGIPRVFECGVLDDRRPWVALERVEGATIADELSGGPMAIVDLVVLLREVADILHHAHGRGVVHGRLTPEVIVRTPARAPLVTVRGWGGAHTVDRADDLAMRDDVYALGVIAFRALTGCLHNPTVSATDWCPWAPAELTALIDVMLDASPRVRPTSEEVRERARWLATTIEPLKIDKPRWTPPNGLDPDTLEPIPPQGGFSIRIGRTRTR